MPTVELDFSTMHITMLYAKVDAELEGDAYTLDGYTSEDFASQALNGITGSNKKQTNNDECDIELDYIPSGIGNSREDLCREQAKQKSLDPQITGNFNLTLGSKFDKSLCTKELDFYVCEIDAQNNKYFDEAQVAFNPESLELVRITSFKDIKSKNERVTCEEQAKTIRAGLIKKGFKAEDITEDFVENVKRSNGRAVKVIKGYEKDITMACGDKMKAHDVVGVILSYTAHERAKIADETIERVEQKMAEDKAKKKKLNCWKL